MLKFRLFFLQISPNPQSFLSFLVKLTAQTDVAYIVHFQSSADKRRNFFTAKWVTISNTCIFVLKCTPVSLLRVKISAAADGLGALAVTVGEYTGALKAITKTDNCPLVGNCRCLEDTFSSYQGPATDMKDVQCVHYYLPIFCDLSLQLSIATCFCQVIPC